MQSSQHIRQYISAVDAAYRAGGTTELSYRNPLQQLLERMMPAAEIIHEPERLKKVGAPDYLIKQTHGRQSILVGCVETKQIGDADLEGKRANKAQFNRYKDGVPNCVFTDYLTFVFHSRNHGALEKVAIGAVAGGGIKPLPENFARFETLLATFQENYQPKIDSAQTLAKYMAGNARLLADIIHQLLAANQSPSLQEQLKAFKEILLPDISAARFSDIYAQTIAHGMLTARLNAPDDAPFSRSEAPKHIPRTNPFIRELLDHIVGIKIEPKIEWLVDGLANIFALSDIRKIMQGYGASRGGDNPYVHFYETFLTEYDPKLRRERGVWYTPAPVVKFIVQAVNDVLQKEFKIKDGLADSRKITVRRENAGGDAECGEVHQVQILDPAVGTGTFLLEVIRCIHGQFAGMKGVWADYVQAHLLPRLHGFELLAASYAIAHMQMELLLRETGIDKTSDRLRVFLTNSLEEYHAFTGPLFVDLLNEEAKQAGIVKQQTPIMCVIGNPPYSGESANKSKWIMRLMKDYKKEPGGVAKLDEKNPKWINDDYVKFIRYGQHYIERNGSGVLAFINAHGFLDNPTFRGMRWNLLNTYDKIYILDLHGNHYRQETAPDGSADQNVFDIKQGVSINIFVKTGKKKKGALAKVFHRDLYGRREDKYAFLSDTTLKSAGYKAVVPQAPMYYMVPRDYALADEYNAGFSVKELFPTNSVGTITARDEFCIQDSRGQVDETIREFLSLSDDAARERFNLGADTRDWQVAYARRDLQENYPDKGRLCEIAYRPFDTRHTFYTGNSAGFHSVPRDVMRNFLDGDNVGFVCVRRQPHGNAPAYYFLSKFVMASGYIRSDSVSIDTLFPLYVKDRNSMYAGSPRRPNLDETIVEKIAAALSLSFTPEKTGKKGTFAPIDVLDYIYATLHSPAYREKYAEYLKIDFPRVPYPQLPVKEFWRLVKLGGELRRLHLLEDVESGAVTYPVEDGNRIEKVEYKNERVYINKTQYFGNVPRPAWEFFIGGYQPAQKWLKDRKDRVLSFDDVTHYKKIIACLLRTGEIMGKID